ncbi:hypothetical protein HAX54_009473, partial [Datura stramonium]|nr:hypothetical protein [Datura stramonium]
MHAWDIPENPVVPSTESAPLGKDLNEPTPSMSGNDSEEAPPPRSSPPPPSSKQSGLQNLVDMTHAHKNHLTKLAKNLLALIL